MNSKRGVLTAAVAFAAAVSGCGGGGSSASTPDGAVRAYLSAEANHDAAKQCSLIGGEFETEVMNALRTASDSGATCVELLSREPTPTSTARTRLETATVTLVSQSGNTATVRVSSSGRAAARVQLTKVGGSWKITREIL